MYSREGFLDLENEKYVISVGRAQLLLLFILEYLSSGNKLLSLGPVCLLPQDQGAPSEAVHKDQHPWTQSLMEKGRERIWRDKMKVSSTSSIVQ